MDIAHDIRQRKFYAFVKNKEYSLEYNELEPKLWEFHCPVISHIRDESMENSIEENLIEYALHYMSRNNIRLFESGSCHHVTDYLSRKRNLQYLIKYVE